MNKSAALHKSAGNPSVVSTSKYVGNHCMDDAVIQPVPARRELSRQKTGIDGDRSARRKNPAREMVDLK